MKTALWFLAILACVLALAAILAPILARSSNDDIQAQLAAQEAIRTQELAQRSQLDLQVAQAQARNQLALDGAWRALALVFAIGLGAAILIAALGGSLAFVDFARLRSKLIHAEPGANTVYPLVMAQAGMIESPAPKLAQRLQAPEPAQVAMIAPACDLPERVTLDAWRAPGWPALPIGVGAGASQVDVALAADWALGLVCGLPGSGKSAMLRSMLAAIASQAPGVRAVIFDAKGSEFTACSGATWLAQPIARSAGEIDALATWLASEQARRAQRLAELDVDDYRQAGEPALCVIVDELAVLASLAPEALQGLTNLARLGRSLGMFSILSTQRISAQTITGELRALSDWVLCFAVERKVESQVAGVIGAESLARLPGRAIYRRGASQEVQTYFVPGWRQKMRSMAQRVGNQLQPVVLAQSASLRAQPVAQPALDAPESAQERAWRVNDGLTASQVDELRQARQAGASLNQLCLRYYGFKDNRSLALVRQALGEFT